MSDQTIESLLGDMLQWLAREPRSYRKSLETWRTSCPRLQIWEEAFDRGFVARSVAADGVEAVSVTQSGRRFLDDRAVAA